MGYGRSPHDSDTLLRMHFLWLLSTVLLSVLPTALFPGGLTAQRGAPPDAWPSYGGDLGSTKYSPLSEIDADNVEHLHVAWTWRSPDDALVAADPDLTPAGFKATPIMVDGVLYIRTSLSQVAAIDAVSGEELWVFDPASYEAGRPVNLGFNTRGVGYWSGDRDSSEPPREDPVENLPENPPRIFVATGDSHLWALDAMTGRPLEEFGDEGHVDLVEGLRRRFDRRSYQVMSPPLVIGDVVVVGSSISDFPQWTTAPPGDVRAFDVLTGEQRWIFRTVPAEGEVGSETWEDDSARFTGNTNVWTMMSADPELGHVYLPVGTPTNDWYGGHRPGDNLFAESVVAVEVATGRRVWHYQIVHHGVWDYDLPAAPTLLDITVDGRPVKGLAQLTKQGFIFVLDRVTGEPIWPVEERPVPASTVPGEKLSPTQPFPTRPAPFERQGITVDDLIDFTPELRAEAEEILAESEHGGLYHPPSRKGTLNLPGWGGGANWYGAAADPSTGVIYLPSRTSPIRVQLVKPDSAESDFRYVRGADQSVAGPRGLPLVKPPYARLTAIDLDTGSHVWQIPLGDGPRRRIIDLGVRDPGPLGGGAYTGPLLTETLLFIGHAGARDGGEGGGPALLALDKETGRRIHVTEVPGVLTGTPMTYRAGGKQHIVAAYGSGGEAGLVALALP